MPIDSKFCTECGTPFPAAEKKEEKPVQPKQETPAAEPSVQPQQPQQPQPQARPAGVQPQVQPQGVNQAQTQIPQQQAQPRPVGVQPQVQQAQQARPQTQQNAAYVPTPVGTYPQNARPVSYGGELTAEDVEGTRYEPVKSIGWVGIDLLMHIPVVGFILTVVWACGGCRKQNKRTFARGKLIEMAIALVLALLLGLALRGAVNKAAQNYAQENGIQYSEDSAIKDVLNSILNQYGYEIVD